MNKYRKHRPTLGQCSQGNALTHFFFPFLNFLFSSDTTCRNPNLSLSPRLNIMYHPLNQHVREIGYQKILLKINTLEFFEKKRIQMFLLLFLWCSLQLSPGKIYFQLKSPDIHLSGAFWQSGYTWRKLYKTLLMMNIKKADKEKGELPRLKCFHNGIILIVNCFEL